MYNNIIIGTVSVASIKRPRVCPKNTGGLKGVIFHCKQRFRAGGEGEVHAVEDAISILLLAIINVALSSDRKLSKT